MKYLFTRNIRRFYPGFHTSVQKERKLIVPKAHVSIVWMMCFCLLTFVVPKAQDIKPVRVKIHINSAEVVRPVSPNFMGLGYEKSAVAQVDFFSPQNKIMIQLYRNLSPHGLIRIGGNVSDHTQYKPDSPAKAHTERETTIINRKNLEDLAAFARATGWKVMWGLNLGTGTREEAVSEAKDVEKIFGDRLQSFQIGNEVDLHGNYKTSYNDFQSYYADYMAYKAAIRKALPKAQFSGPDVAGNINWLRSFAQKQAPDIKLLTIHYYRTGATRPDATIPNLLMQDDKWNDELYQLEQVADKSHVPFRINEVNSFYGGGKPGVSNTFASALWSLDYMFDLASYGCEGINLETDINQLGWISHYSPIVHDAKGHCSVRPEYYGMLAFSLAGKGNLVKLHLKKDLINLTAYATETTDKDGSLWVAIINKDLLHDADVEISLSEKYKAATLFLLKAPSVESTNQATLSNAEVAADGKWTPGSGEKIIEKEGVYRVLLHHANAALLHLQRL